jgi:predicted ribosomally synthesized peptide with SipW-like signal peptide
MTDERFDISRRKALAALGTIGVASAGAGLGTSAYFSDQETFENNQLMAGTLDVGVGYSAHYSDWMPNDDGLAEDANGVDVVMFEGDPNEVGDSGDLAEQAPAGYTGLPANDAWLIAVDDPDQFLANTQYQSFNDEDGALTSCPLSEDDQAEAAPVAIDLDDVKPGDFGEVTFDFRICDNPGFVWLTGELNSASENGVTEPEADDPQEDGPTDETITEASEIGSSDIELLDVVQTAIWVDDGDNYQDGGESPTIQSLGSLLESLGGEGPGVGVAGNTAPEDGGGAASARNCFAGDEKHSIAFAWWVPIDHGNEIQSDSVSFDLGLYTEQCRHNDGSGMNDQETDDGDGGDGGSTTSVTVSAFPDQGDDLGATIETVNVNFPSVDSIASVDDTSWSVGPSGTENVTIDGTTVELDYPDNSNTYTSDTFLELTVSVSASPGTYTAEFVYEDDDDSQVDNTDSFSI